MYRDLVPGLTNVTNRLRYYSFYCWVVWKYETTEHADDDKRWKIFIRRAEALFALSSQMHEPDGTGGVAGGDWANPSSSPAAGRSNDRRRMQMGGRGSSRCSFFCWVSTWQLVPTLVPNPPSLAVAKPPSRNDERTSAHNQNTTAPPQPKPTWGNLRRT